jgi:hypothetical protein
MFYDIPIVTLIYACQIVSGDPTPHDYIDDVRWFPLHEPPPLAFDIVRDAIDALGRKLDVEG